MISKARINLGLVLCSDLNVSLAYQIPSVLSKYLLSFCSVPGALLAVSDLVVKTDESSALECNYSVALICYEGTHRRDT